MGEHILMESFEAELSLSYSLRFNLLDKFYHELWNTRKRSINYGQLFFFFFCIGVKA